MFMTDVDTRDVGHLGILEVECVAEWLLDVERLECLEVLDVQRVDKGLMQVDDVKCMAVLDVYFLAYGLAHAEDGVVVDVEEADCMRILNLDATCYADEGESDENEVESQILWMARMCVCVMQSRLTCVKCLMSITS